MKHFKSALAVLLLSVVLLNAAPVLGEATPTTEEVTTISSYWHPRVQQWSSLIVSEAEGRSLDPDFLASLIWMESRGRATAVGPVGAVGLMQVMPREAGFAWRPSREELLTPETNLFWGTRTLATVVGQGHGDIFNALAAYNGGWDQIQYRGPHIFATTILRDYAQAVARRRNFPSRERWLAIFAVAAPNVRGPIWVADSARDDVYFFSNKNWLPEGSPLIPESLPPISWVAHCEEEDGTTYSVGVWFYSVSQDKWFIQ